VLAWRVDWLKRKAAKQYVSPMVFADTYAQLGRKEETIRYLEESYQEREPHVVYLQSDPNFDFLYADPHYRAIVNKMGLSPTYGPSGKQGNTGAEITGGYSAGCPRECGCPTHSRTFALCE